MLGTPDNKKTIDCECLPSYVRQNFGFFPLLTRIVYCLANARQQLFSTTPKQYSLRNVEEEQVRKYL